MKKEDRDEASEEVSTDSESEDELTEYEKRRLVGQFGKEVEVERRKSSGCNSGPSRSLAQPCALNNMIIS